jgi:branched-chain amino acid transport system substrate-binding protein
MIRAALRRASALLAFAALLAVPNPVRADDPLAIDVILPLTGTNTYIGQGLRKGLEALQKMVNTQGGVRGRPIVLTFYDDQTNPQVDVQLANEIISRKVALIVGPASTAGCHAVAPLLKDGPVLYCLSPSLHSPAGSYAFSVNASTNDQAVAALRYFVGRGLKRIAMITTIDANGQDADAAVDFALNELKAQSMLIDREHFSAGDISVSAQAARIKAANPDAVIAWTTGAPFGTVLHALKDVGLDVPVLTTNANSNRAILGQLASYLPTNLYIPDPFSELALADIRDARIRRAVEAFRTAMAANGIVKPDGSNAAAWDAGLLVVDAFRRLGPGATAPQIRDLIANTTGFVGIKGAYDFRAVPQRGLGQSAVVVVRWDPASETFAAASAPGGAPVR